jgi:cell division protein FtsQ
VNAVLRIVAWMIAIALVAAPVVAVLNGWIGGERWPMRRLVLTAEFHQVGEAQVRAAVSSHVRHGFFAVDPEAVRADIAALPWVRRVEVRKRWPDRLDVAIAEYRPLARWGERRMLSENGELFAAPAKAAAMALPRFDGPEARRAELMAFYSEARPLFLAEGVRIRAIALSARGSWTLRLSDGVQVEVGRGDPQRRLQRFARLLPRLRATDSRRLVRADLRYTNGFALTWQEAIAPVPAQPASNQAIQGKA